MARVRVPIHRTSPTQSVLIDPAATVGAQIGVNLLLPDGSAAKMSDFGARPGGDSSASIDTSDDIDEGAYHFWFTDRRAQDAAGSILANSTTISLAYVAGTSITATLNDLADSGTGAALVKITRDAKGRISGTSAATTTDLAEGVNLYFTATRVLATVLAGLSTATNAVITATDTVLSALGKLQAQITANLATLTAHTSNTSNPHGVTKTQVGLANVDNTSDVNKPVSTAQAAADALRVLKSGDTMTGNLATTGVFGSGGTAFAGDALFTGSQAGLWAQSSTAAARFVCLSSASNVQFIGARCGGTLATPTATPTLVALLEFDASSYTGSGWVYPGTAAWVTTEAHSPTARGTRYEISTTPIGTTTLLKRLHIDRSGNGAVGPGADNTQDLGEASLRWAVVRAGTGSINTSDAREKTDVVPLTAAELAAAADLARAPGTYQWLAAVQAKGADARWHAGLTVQQAIAIMQSHGLDPMRYGFICYDQWPETPEVVNSWPAQDAVLDDEGNVVTPAVEAGSEIAQEYRPAGDRYSFRHDELLLFIVRGFAARLDALESA